MKKILAISGGVDSMVLLWKNRNEPEAVVAHFNHGTRPSAETDEEFVRKAAAKYGKKFIAGRGQLGEGASEAEARTARYNFLKQVAADEDGKIVTAHHLDDVLESVAINLLRGTGWRGLTVMSNAEVERPMLLMSKKEIYQIAAAEQLTFRQDPTNVEDYYLRNRVREKLRELPQAKREALAQLWQDQTAKSAVIKEIIKSLLPKDGIFQRNWFLEMEDGVALEILKEALAEAGVLATRPQILEFLEAIRNYASEKSFNLPKGRLVKIHKTYFRLRD